MELEGRVALVTGASGGIGQAVAWALAEAGVTAVVTYFEEGDGIEETLAGQAARGVPGFALQLDQRHINQIEQVVAEVMRRAGRLDILINNAGWNVGIPFAALEALTPELWDRVLETNLRGPYLVSRAAAPFLRAGEGGRIVNISSIAGFRPSGSSIAYSCSKAGVNMLTSCLAIALAPEVLVNGIAPGLVPDTRMAGWMPVERQTEVSRRALLGHAATRADLASATLELCRTESITGQVLVVDAGQTVR